jgi:hypothetical protein
MWLDAIEGNRLADRMLLMAETLTACGLFLSQRAHGIELRCARSGNPRR